MKEMKDQLHNIQACHIKLLKFRVILYNIEQICLLQLICLILQNNILPLYPLQYKLICSILQNNIAPLYPLQYQLICSIMQLNIPPLYPVQYQLICPMLRRP